MSALVNRLVRLEQRHRPTRTEPERVFSCLVRAGREEADHAEAFGRLGMSPADTDLILRRVIFSAAGSRMDGIEPKARLLSAAPA